MSRSEVVFIGCGKRKKKGLRAVCELYDGVYFRLCLAVARTITDDDHIYVISARHGVLRLWDRIRDYDLKLTDLSSEEVIEWRKKLKAFVDEKREDGFVTTFVCSRLYHDGLEGEKILPQHVGIGKQMGFMKRLLNRRGGFGLC